MIPCAILSIGEEILEGSIVDTNSSHIANLLSTEGFAPQLIKAMPDDKSLLVAGIREAMAKYPLVISTGGLGPTFDDLTPEAVAQACDRGLTIYEEVKQHVKRRLERLGVTVKGNHFQQAALPERSVLFENLNGTAYGFGVEYNGSLIVSMPGVPFEMKPMLRDKVMPLLRERFEPEAPYRETLKFANLPESDLDNVVRNLGVPGNVKCIINASSGEVYLKVRSEDYDVGNKFAEAVRSHFPANYYGKNAETPAGLIIDILRNNKMTLSVAESCTGGLLGGALTAVPGASDVFRGGVISYSNAVKINQLGVNPVIIEQYGAVSRECAEAMAEGVKTLLDTGCSISVTGIAGPEGGTPDKPVGTVWIGICANGKTLSTKILAGGEREDIRQRSVRSALLMLLKELQ